MAIVASSSPYMCLLRSNCKNWRPKMRSWRPRIAHWRGSFPNWRPTPLWRPPPPTPPPTPRQPLPRHPTTANRYIYIYINVDAREWATKVSSTREMSSLGVLVASVHLSFYYRIVSLWMADCEQLSAHTKVIPLFLTQVVCCYSTLFSIWNNCAL